MTSDPSRPRILPLDDDRTPPPLNIFRTLKRNRPLFKAFLTLGMHLLNDGSLPARERELVILRIGWRCRSEYEFSQHTRIGLAAGLTEQEVGWLAEREEAAWSARDSSLVQLVDELFETDQVRDQTWQRLQSEWSDTEMLELLVLTGFYRMVSGMLNAVGVPLEPDASGWPAGVQARTAPRRAG